jgi:hypothetical protein
VRFPLRNPFTHSIFSYRPKNKLPRGSSALMNTEIACCTIEPKSQWESEKFSLGGKGGIRKFDEAVQRDLSLSLLTSC